MIFTKPGRDVITISDNDYFTNSSTPILQKVHLIKLKFSEPTENKMKWVFTKYANTNRFIIEDNVRIYNYYFKKTNKKFYVENSDNNKLITFFKKNNKILLNCTKLSGVEYEYVINSDSFQDILNNIEIILMYYNDFKDMEFLLKKWDGNVIIYDKDYVI